jgi:protein gp37
VGKVTEIAWTDHTFNPWIGCTKVSAGCAHCYAETLNHRWGGDNWGPGKERRVTAESNWKQPLQWAKEAAKAGVRRRVFCASLADLFEAEAPVEARRRLWELIDESCYALDWQLVTKRPERIKAVMLDDGLPSWFFMSKRCWLMTTVENQEQTKRIPHLLAVDAAVHGVSVEPMLSTIDLSQWLSSIPLYACQHCGEGFGRGEEDNGLCPHCHRGVGDPIGESDNAVLDWVIVGGESGPGARPMHPDWARSLRDQCKAAGVAYFFKQWGEWSPEGPLQANQCCVCFDCGARLENTIQDVEKHYFSGGHKRFQVAYHVGKKAAGRLLDGREWNEFPEVAHV